LAIPKSNFLNAVLLNKDPHELVKQAGAESGHRAPPQTRLTIYDGAPSLPASRYMRIRTIIGFLNSIENARWGMAVRNKPFNSRRVGGWGTPEI